MKFEIAFEFSFCNLQSSFCNSLPLIQIFFDPFGFSQEEWNVEFAVLHEAIEHLHCLGELGGEFLLLLIAPCRTKALKLFIETRELRHELGIEMFKLSSEPADIGGIDNGL